jgi:hypothetical protein
LREAGFTERQVEGPAEALAAAMTDTQATKRDFQEHRRDVQDVRRDVQERATGSELTQLRHEMAKLSLRMDVRFAEQSALLDAHFDRLETMIADLHRRFTLRMMMAMGVVAVLVKVL